MSRTEKSYVLVIFVMVLGLGHGAVAQTGAVVSTSPNLMIRGVQTTLLVTGTGFQSGDLVVLRNPCGEMLFTNSTTFLNSYQMLATLQNQRSDPLYSVRVLRGHPFSPVELPGSGQLRIADPPLAILSFAPATLVAGATGTSVLSLQVSGALTTTDCLGFPTLRADWQSPGQTGFAFVANFGGVNIPLPQAATALPGTLTLTLQNSLSISPTATVQIPIVCNTLLTSATQPYGPGSLSLATLCGTPGAPYVTAFSFDPLNQSQPGQGFWGGLHIALTDLAFQVATQAPPFFGTLDAQGESLFLLPAGILPPGMPRTWFVTRTFGPGTFNILETSTVGSILPL